MLLGEYEHTIDGKNRVTLPARFRAAFAQGVFLARGVDRCVVLYTPESWERHISSRLGGMDQMSRRTRDMRRLIYAGAMDAQLDRQGRVVLSPALIDHANLDHEVIVAGLLDHAEIWHRASWRARIEEVQNNAELDAEHLADGE